MPPIPDSRDIPGSVRAASFLLALYGVAVLVNALMGQMATEWVDAADFPRGVLRTAGCVYLAWALLSRKRWAWWIAVILIALWTVLAGTGGALLTYLATTGTEVPAMGLFFWAAVSVLLAAEIFLLLPASRAWFREPSAPAAE